MPDHRIGEKYEDGSRGADRALRAPFKFGLGGVTLGNEFEVITDEVADETLGGPGTPVCATTTCHPGTGSGSHKDASGIIYTTGRLT